jgi:hypothetical protein
MRGVSKGVSRVAAVLAVSAILVAQGAFAAEKQVDRGQLLDRLARAKQIIVKILTDIGLPPG